MECLYVQTSIGLSSRLQQEILILAGALDAIVPD